MTIPSYMETIESLDPIAQIYKGFEDRDSKAELTLTPCDPRHWHAELV